jgi:chromosomal replication initiation ATPase DnaA
MNELAVQDNRRPTHCLFPPNPDHPQPGDLVLDTLVGALRATVAHPDESVQMLAEATLDEVRRIQRAARRKLVAQQRDVSAKRLDLLVAQVAAALQLDVDKLKSRARQQHVAFQRQTAMYVARRLSDASWPSLARAFNRDHSTLYWACQVIERRVARDGAFRRSIESLQRRISDLTTTTTATAA